METNTDLIELEADWMTDREIALARQYWKDIKETLQKRNIDLTPLMALSIDEVLKAHILMKRFERYVANSLATLDQQPKTPSETVPEKEKTTPVTPTQVIQFIDALGRARGRLHKAICDIQKSLGLGNTHDTGEAKPVVFANLLKPILEKADGVLEEALGPEFAQLAGDCMAENTGP